MKGVFKSRHGQVRVGFVVFIILRLFLTDFFCVFRVVIIIDFRLLFLIDFRVLHVVIGINFGLFVVYVCASRVVIFVNLELFLISFSFCRVKNRTQRIDIVGMSGW